VRKFTLLFEELDSTTKSNEKIEALVRYFNSETFQNISIALKFLFGERIPRIASPKELRAWVSEISGVVPWLMEESYEFVGDLAETVSLLVPPGQCGTLNLSICDVVNNYLRPLHGMEESVRKQKIIEIWNRTQGNELLLINKMLTGGLRVGASKRLVLKAMSRWQNLPEELIATRAVGAWIPSEESLIALITPELDGKTLLPKPFSLASPLDVEVNQLGEECDWSVEWKWDGIRAQIVKTAEGVTIWSRGEEVINHSFPELVDVLADIKNENFILDGEIVVWNDSEKLPAPFSVLQKRLGRKNVSRKIIIDNPIKFIAYDLLHVGDSDLVESRLEQRKCELKSLFKKGVLTESLFKLSSEIEFQSWEELKSIRSTARKMKAEGLMLKKISSSYVFGRKKGHWWKWKLDPFKLDLVLMYAQSGHGRRAGLFSDFTFGIWSHDGKLLPLAKAYSGLTDVEMKKINTFVRKNKIGKFGPVVHVKPELVFEVAFEGIQISARHKSGYSLRFPRISRIRDDKLMKDADTIASLENLLKTIEI